MDKSFLFFLAGVVMGVAIFYAMISGSKNKNCIPQEIIDKLDHVIADIKKTI
jgi:hypothetical protein